MKLFVGNLPWRVRDNDLVEMFSEHGHVTSANVVMDRDTGRSRGFGVVSFDNMGEANAAAESRKGFTRRSTLMAAAARYRELFADDGGRVPATFQIITLTGWAPDPSQQQPLKPGSAEARLADALDTVEIPAGEKAKPAK